MKVKEHFPGQYIIEITPEENYNLNIVIINACDPKVATVSQLIEFTLSHISENAFLTIQEPPNYGHPSST